MRNGALAIYITGVFGVARMAYLEFVDDALHGRLRHQHVVCDSKTLCGHLFYERGVQRINILARRTSTQESNARTRWRAFGCAA